MATTVDKWAGGQLMFGKRASAPMDEGDRGWVVCVWMAEGPGSRRGDWYVGHAETLPLAAFDAGLRVGEAAGTSYGPTAVLQREFGFTHWPEEQPAGVEGFAFSEGGCVLPAPAVLAERLLQAGLVDPGEVFVIPTDDGAGQGTEQTATATHFDFDGTPVKEG